MEELLRCARRAAALADGANGSYPLAPGYFFGWLQPPCSARSRPPGSARASLG